MLHVTACFWFVASFGNVTSNVNWVSVEKLQDSGIVFQYITSLYWATVTCTTVGYGDILPSNGYELFWSMAIIVFGVAIFSFVLSSLSSQFSEISKSNANNTERLKQIEELDLKFHVGAELVD